MASAFILNTHIVFQDYLSQGMTPKLNNIFLWHQLNIEQDEQYSHTNPSIKVEKKGQSLGYFGVIEDTREALNISEYSLSQTSLYHIFKPDCRSATIV